MHNMFNIIRYSWFLFWYIVRYISVVEFREKLVAIVAVWFELIALFKFAKILNSRVRIGIDFAISLISLIN